MTIVTLISNNIRLFGRTRLLVSILCALCAFVVNLPAQEFKTVKDGIEYAEVTKEISGIKVNMNLLRLDLTKVRLDVVHAKDAAIGTEKTSSIATRHGAFAAINAGFFRLDTSLFAGDSAGVLIIDHKLLSESLNNRISLEINNKPKRTETAIEHLNVRVALYNGKHLISTMPRLNCERKPGDIVIYTPEFGATTLTNSDGDEIIVRNPRDEKKSIVEYQTSAGNSAIPKNGFVISLTGSVGTEVESSAHRCCKAQGRQVSDDNSRWPDGIERRDRFAGPGGVSAEPRRDRRDESRWRRLDDDVSRWQGRQSSVGQGGRAKGW